jgi:uncharacterized protein (TIGR00297 family)
VWSLLAVTGLVFGGLALFGHPEMPAHSNLWRIPQALTLNAGLAAAALAIGAVTPGGALTGAVVGAALFTSAGWPAWILLGCAFVSTVLSTRWRQDRKNRLGIAEPRGGRRAAGNIAANTGLAGIASVMAILQPQETAWVVAAAAALAAGAADTVASEVGKAIGGRTWLVPTFTEVAPGTTGAVSTAGTLAAALASSCFGMVAMAVRVVPTAIDGASIALAATLACVLEGWVAGVAEEPGLLDNDGVNFAASGIAAGLAVMLSSALS